MPTLADALASLMLGCLAATSTMVARPLASTCVSASADALLASLLLLSVAMLRVPVGPAALLLDVPALASVPLAAASMASAPSRSDEGSAGSDMDGMSGAWTMVAAVAASAGRANGASLLPASAAGWPKSSAS